MDNFTRSLRTLKTLNNKGTKISIFVCSIQRSCFTVVLCLFGSYHISWLIAIRTKTIQVSALLPLAKVRNSSLLPLNVYTREASITVRYSLRTKTPYCNNESLLGVDIHLQLKIAYDYYVLASRDDLLIFALIRVHTYYRAPHFSNSSSLTLLPGILAFRKLNVSTFTMQESKFQELSQDCELTFEQYSYVQ